LRVTISDLVLNAPNCRVGFPKAAAEDTQFLTDVRTRPPGFVISGYFISLFRSILDLVQNPRSLLKTGWRLCLMMDTGLRRYGELLMDICFLSFRR
jgi:hypothetical protein